MRDSTRWWWPDSMGSYYWPSSARRDETLDAFKEAFRTLGYYECESDDFEYGYEKVAIFADDSNNPTHAARQLSNGKWTSKCGIAEDIEHDLIGVAGREYGSVACIMKRRINNTPNTV